MLGKERERLNPRVFVGFAVDLVKAAVVRAHNVGNKIVLGFSISLL
jgi:hypothetical protein